MAVLSALQNGVWTSEAAKINFIRNSVTGIAFDIVAERADPDLSMNKNPYQSHTEILEDLVRTFGSNEKARLAQGKLFAANAYQRADESYNNFLARFNADFRCLRMDDDHLMIHLKRLMRPDLSRNAANAGVIDANLHAFNDRVRRIEADRQYNREQERFRPSATDTQSRFSRRYRDQYRERDRDRPTNRDRDRARRDRDNGDRDRKKTRDSNTRLDATPKKYKRTRKEHDQIVERNGCLGCGQQGHKANSPDCPRYGKDPVPSKDIAYLKSATVWEDEEGSLDGDFESDLDDSENEQFLG
jgi:hypothetical protein